MGTIINNPIREIHIKMEDGTTAICNGVQSLELQMIVDSNSDIDYCGEIRRIDTVTFEGIVKLKANNNRNRTSKRYIKNRKGYRWLDDLFR